MSNYWLRASDDHPLSTTLDDPVGLSEGNRSSPTDSDDLMAPSQGSSLFADRNDDIIDLGATEGRPEPGRLEALLARILPAPSRTAMVVTLVAGLALGHVLGTSRQPSGAAPVMPAAPATSDSAAPAATVAPPPQVGLCHEYSRDAEGEAVEASDPVSCRAEHDAVTVARIDRPGIDVSLVGASYRTSTRAMVRCQRAAERYLGIGRGVTFSRYSSSVFVPDRAQLDAGQHWLRCDLVKFPTYYGLMPLPEKLRGSLTYGPDLIDAYCVSPHALRGGMAPRSRMESPELGDWAGQVDCVGTGALVAVRRATVETPAAGPAGCRHEARRFRGLALTALVAPTPRFWGEVLCVAHVADYESWVANGKPLTAG